MTDAPHVPVLKDETLGLLQPGKGKRIIDGTFGFGGQQFIKECLDKVSRVAAKLEAAGLMQVEIEVDGGEPTGGGDPSAFVVGSGSPRTRRTARSSGRCSGSADSSPSAKMEMAVVLIARIV